MVSINAPPRTFLYYTLHSAGSVLTVYHRVQYICKLFHTQCNVLCGACSTTSWCCITGTDTVYITITFLMHLKLLCQTLAKHAQHTKFFLTYMLCILRWFLTSGALIMQLTFNEERISHCAVAFFILGHAGVPSWHSGLFYHQGAHTLRESSNDGMITEYSRHNYKSTWD